MNFVDPTGFSKVPILDILDPFLPGSIDKIITGGGLVTAGLYAITTVSFLTGVGEVVVTVGLAVTAVGVGSVTLYSGIKDLVCPEKVQTIEIKKDGTYLDGKKLSKEQAKKVAEVLKKIKEEKPSTTNKNSKKNTDD